MRRVPCELPTCVCYLDIFRRSQCAQLLPTLPPGFSVLQVTATDEDSGLNGELTYRIEAGAQDRFLIHPVTGVIRVGNVTIDREEQESYRLTVVASDRGTVPLSGTAIITILIDDINDCRPEFLNPIQTVSVLESAEPGTVIANVTAIDRDLNPKLEYHIVSIVAKDDTDRLVPDQEDAFAVNINTGTRACSPFTPAPDSLSQSLCSLLSSPPSSLVFSLALSLSPHFPSAALLSTLCSPLLTAHPSLSFLSLLLFLPSLLSLLPSLLTSSHRCCMRVSHSPPLASIKYYKVFKFVIF